MTKGWKVDDAFDSLLEPYSQGDIPSLVRLLIPTPSSSYDDLISTNPLLPSFVNYLDACLYGSYFDVHYCSLILKKLLQDKAPSLTPLRARLDLEFDWIEALLTIKPAAHLPRYLREFLEKGTADTAALIPPQYASWFQSYRNTHEHLKIFTQSSPYLSAFASSMQTPLYPMNREIMINQEALEDESPALLIFNDDRHLIQSLQFPDVLQALTNPQNALYILDRYPHAQILGQPHMQALPKRFLSPHPYLLQAIPLLTQAIDAVFTQSLDALKNDTEVGDWLYQIAKRVLFSIRQKRLGKSRTPALIEQQDIKRWEDPHKGLPDSNRDLGPIPLDYFRETLEALGRTRKPFKNRIHIMHVTAQIIDGKHAPSSLLETLVQHRNANLFKVSVLVTERLAFRVFDYPFRDMNADSSSDRGKERIQAFKDAGVDVKILNPKQTFLESAHAVAKELEANDVDIVVFHGPDVIHCMATTLAPCPLRVMFEHGTPLTYPGFDLMIASSMDAPRLYGEKYASFHTRIEPLPFNIDVTKSWPEDPPQLSELGIPEGSLVMTTISNHLDSRLGNQMVHAIAEILKQVPKAFYAPIGPIHDEKKGQLLQIFKDKGVADRITFLGRQMNPGHLARCMKLYLNEFPFGSCLGMLEAMASGCIPISMHDPNGPSQARYGADFMGTDHVITSGKIEDYVLLACNLLNNPELYRKWSDYTKSQYKKHSNESNYVIKFESILFNNFKSIN